MPNNFDKLFNQAQGNELINALKGIKSSLDVNYPLETVNVTLSNNAQNITPSENYYGLGQVNVPGMNLSDMTILVNGNYDPVTSGLDGYGKLNVNVPTWGQADEGKVVSNNALVPQTNREVNANGTYDTTLNNSVLVNVPNTYGSEDEGKVVMNNALVPQTNRSITQNGTYDTTTNDEVVVNVSGGGDAKIYRFIDETYYMDETGLICTIDGRTYTKIYSDPAFVAYFYNGSYTGPVLVSKTENGAVHQTSISTTPFSPTQEIIDGETWYVSQFGYPMAGDKISTDGYATKLTGSYATPKLAAEALLQLAYDNTITENGSYTVPEGYDGFGDFNVDVEANTETLSVTQNGTYTPSTGKDGFSRVAVNVSGGGGSKNILSGTEAPTSSIGEDGDIYLLYQDVCLKNTTTQYINTGYHGNNNSEYKVCFRLETAQSSPYPTPFGARSASGAVTNASYVHLGTPNYIAWGTSQYNNPLNFTTADLIGKVATLELKAGYCKLSFGGNDYTYTFTPTSISDTTPIGLFTALWNGVVNETLCKNMALYYMEISESGTLVHRFVPALDSNDVPCVYDEVAEEYKYNSGSGSFIYSESGEIASTYCKVNGAWQPLIDTDIDDVNTEGSGGAKNILGGTTAPTSADGTDGDIYIKYTDYGDIDGYTVLEYLGVGDTAGPYIDTGVYSTSDAYFAIDIQYTGSIDNNTWAFGAWQSYKDTILGMYPSGQLRFLVGGSGKTGMTFNYDRHFYEAKVDGVYQDRVFLSGVNWQNTPSSLKYYIFNISGQSNSYTKNLKVYSCKIWNGTTLVRNFIPAKRNSDDALGMYDLVNDVFYTNSGTGEFIGGSELTGTPIDTVYLKSNGSWGILEDGDWSNVTKDGKNKNILSGTTTPTSGQGANGDIYIEYTDYSSVSGYTLLEYLQSNGNQSIDTGVDMTNQSYYETKCAATQSTQESNFYGIGYSNKESNIIVASNRIYLQIGSRNISIPYDTAKHLYKANNVQMSIDSIVDTPNWSNVPTGQRIRLFATAYGGNFTSNRISYTKMYYCKIWNGDTLVRDFIPAKRNSDDALGMYDLVNDVFYTNDGTGSFIGGSESTGKPINATYLKVDGDWIILEDGDYSEVNTQGNLTTKTITQNGTYTATDDNADGYSEVVVNVSGGEDWTSLKDYIESSGTQWIDTNYIPNENSQFELVANISAVNNVPCAYGVRELASGSANSLGVFLFPRYSNSNNLYYSWGTDETSLEASTPYLNKKSVWKIKKTKVYVESQDEDIKAKSFNGGTVTSQYSLYIFSLNQGGSEYGAITRCTMKLYRFRIYESDVLVHEYVPWTDTNDVVCLKDTVTGNLFYNAGTGNFVRGEDE